MVLVEHHEDVVLVKPARLEDSTSARFFFHQVKDVSGKPWTAKHLIQRKKTEKKLGNSVLGKLVQGTHGKPFTPQLEAILIVATCGFQLPQLKADQSYQELAHSDLAPEAQNQLKEAVETELGHAVDLARLRLLKPSLGSDYVAGVLKAIVDLVDLKMPGAKSNPRYIYQGLIDELHRRGAIQYDYQSWEKLIREKALTGTEVERTLQIHTAVPDGDQIAGHISEVGTKLGLPLNARIRLSGAASTYYRRRKFTRSLDQLRVNADLEAAVNAHWELTSGDDLVEFSRAVKAALRPDTLQFVESAEGFDAAVACEFILKSLGGQ